jgi:hypothetical protein
MSSKIDKVDECLSLSCLTSSVAVRIYDLIRGVGYGELTADNALHQLIEEYKNLNSITDRLNELADAFEKEEEK